MNKTQDKAIHIRMHMQSYAYTCTHTHTYMNNRCFSTPSPQKGTTTDRSTYAYSVSLRNQSGPEIATYYVHMYSRAPYQS